MPRTLTVNLIAEAVAPLKQAAINRARAFTSDRLTEMASELVGKNLRVGSPPPTVNHEPRRIHQRITDCP